MCCGHSISSFSSHLPLSSYLLSFLTLSSLLCSLPISLSPYFPSSLSLIPCSFSISPSLPPTPPHPIHSPSFPPVPPHPIRSRSLLTSHSPSPHPLPLLTTRFPSPHPLSLLTSHSPSPHPLPLLTSHSPSPYPLFCNNNTENHDN